MDNVKLGPAENAEMRRQTELWTRRTIEPAPAPEIGDRVIREMEARPRRRGYAASGTPPVLLFRTEHPDLWLDWSNTILLPHGWDVETGGIFTVTLIPQALSDRAHRVMCCVLECEEALADLQAGVFHAVLVCEGRVTSSVTISVGGDRETHDLWLQHLSTTRGKKSLPGLDRVTYAEIAVRTAHSSEKDDPKTQLSWGWIRQCDSAQEEALSHWTRAGQGSPEDSRARGRLLLLRVEALKRDTCRAVSESTKIEKLQLKQASVLKGQVIEYKEAVTVELFGGALDDAHRNEILAAIERAHGVLTRSLSGAESTLWKKARR